MHPSFDADFVPHAGVVFVDLQNEVGFAVSIENTFEVLDDKGIGGAFERCNQYGI